MFAILIGILVAAIVYFVCIAIGLPYVVAVIAALLVIAYALADAGGWRRGPRV